MVKCASGMLWRTAMVVSRRSGRRSYAVIPMHMPAMSPTMTEGGIAQWKKRDGQSFSAGDVLLEIETDKATIDVEAQDDGVLGKILVPDGTKNVSIGTVIALLAEDGDDISNLQAPQTTAPPVVETPPPHQAEPVTRPIAHHDRVFPSVHRLLREHSIPDLSVIPASGVRGMVTKGDVLAYVGLASSPTGTYHPSTPSPPTPPALDGLAIRRLIVSALKPSSFDRIIIDYL